MALAFILYRQAERSLVADSRQRVEGAASLAAQVVDEQTLRFSELVASHAGELSSLSDHALTKLTPRQAAAVRRQLETLRVGTRGLRAAAFVSPSGVLLLADPPAPTMLGRSFAFRDWYKGVTSQHSPYVSRAFHAAGVGAPKTVTVAALVRSDRSGQPIGIVTVGLERRTQELADSFARAHGLKLTVTDQAGTIVARSGASSNDLVSVRHDPLIAAALAGRSGFNGGDDSLTGYAPIADTGWAVSASIPKAVAFQGLHRLRTLVVISTVILGLLLAALAAGVVLLLGRERRIEVRRARRFQALLESAPDATVIVDERGEIVFVNAQVERLFGHRPQELIGRKVEALIPHRFHHRHVAHRASFSADPSARAMGDGLELVARRKDGTEFPAEVNLSPMVDGRDHLVSATVRDVSGRREYENRLQYLADHDGLTDLFNRRRFEEDLSAHLAQLERYGGGGALLLLDLDNFKYVNDTLGHSVGDALIRAVASAMRRRLRESDVLARLGGDEFAILLPAVDRAQAAAVATDLLNAVRTAEVVADGTRRLRTTASIGIAMLADIASGHYDDLLAEADLAMYAAKARGRDAFAFCDPDSAQRAELETHLRWLDRIRVALDEDLFVLEAQPILDLVTGRVTQQELLLRMRDDGQLIPPNEFLPVAERHGLSRALDRWVIRAAVELAAQTHAPDAPRLEVNLSADSLADPVLLPFIAAQLDRHGVEPERLIFEITETAAIANLATASDLLHQLSELGCACALDDFGAGFASFYYLKHLPFEYLKIDGEFIRRLPASRADQQIVSAIVSAARGLGKITVAEHVGDAATLKVLRDYGVDYAQGFYIGHPTALTTSPTV